ncbi:MAG: hypothetical protein LC808_24005, partial [Actinobacteria bacterium]|nr:hypothetical protein [Actinomycetota bacterium]
VTALSPGQFGHHLFADLRNAGLGELDGRCAACSPEPVWPGSGTIAGHLGSSPRRGGVHECSGW